MSPIYVPGKVTLAKEFTWNETVWNPSMLSTALWLDAADVSTITESGGAVSQWDDKSGNGRDASQSIAGSQPLLVSNTYNNLPTIRTDGVDDFLSITPFSVAAGIRAYGVINSLSLLRRNGDWLWMTDYVSASPHYSGIQDDWYGSFFSTSRPAIKLGGIPSDALAIAFVEQTGTALKGRVFGYIAESTVPATFNGSPSSKFQIVSTYSSYPGKFDICEIILVQSPTLDQQEKIEGYLAHKWGITANLSNDHPYKLVGPTP